MFNKAVAIIFIISMSLSISKAAETDFTIGVVQDNANFNNLITELKKEVVKLNEGDIKIGVKIIAKSISNAADANKAVKKAFEDIDVDLVVTAGIISTQTAYSFEEKLSKPVVCATAPMLAIAYPPSGRVPEKENFAYALIPGRIERDIRELSNLCGSKDITILAPKQSLEACKQSSIAFKALAERMSIKLRLIGIADKLPQKAEIKSKGVYLLNLGSGNSKYKDLIKELNAKKLFTLSSVGHKDIENGVLAALMTDTTHLLARHGAMNIRLIMRSGASEKMDYKVTPRERLVINKAAADAIGYSPDFKTLMRASMVNSTSKSEKMTITDAVDIALRQNVDLKIAQSNIEISRHQKNSALSNLLPSGSVNYNAAQIDSDRAKTSGMPWRQTNNGFSVSHSIFDYANISRFRQGKRQYLSKQHELTSQRLNIMQTVSKAYLNYLNAEAQLRIETDNMKLNRDNLELARVRYKVGRSGPEEIYRWETREADSNSLLLARRSNVQQTRVAINQLLGMDMKKKWKAKDIILADGEDYFLKGRLGKQVKNLKSLEKFREFSVKKAVENSPQLMAIKKLIEAKKIDMRAKGWRFFLPTAKANIGFAHEMSAMNTGQYTEKTEETDNDAWTATLTLELPIFEGTDRIHKYKEAKAEYLKLAKQHEKARQLIEQKVRTTVYALNSSFPKIRFTRIAADRARKNLTVSLDKYKQGAVSILDLLDAQSTAFLREQMATLSVYQYLADLFDYQRSISWFESDKTEKDKVKLINELEEYMKK